MVVLGALLVLAAGAYGLTALLGSYDSGTPIASAPATAGPSARSATPTAVGSSRPVSWLGMEIETVQPGAAVIETVPVGTPGERAGLQPGDVILGLNHRSIHGADDIAGAIRGLRAGDQVDVQISYGSSLYGTQVTLAEPPTTYP